MHNYEDFFVKAEKLADKIDANRDKLIQELGAYETYDAAKDEILRSTTTLRGVRKEFAEVETNVDDLTICTFFPLNLPLYSLVLFAIVPGAFAEKVYVRAPEIMQKIMETVSSVLDIEKAFPNVKIKQVGRAAFVDIYAKAADVILFTGRYENALLVQKECPQALFIFNGGGVNPAIVYDDADIELAADKIFEMRTFNSGQDCAGTDAIFVHADVVEEFIAKLESKAAKVRVGPYSDPRTEVGPILKKEYVDSLVQYLQREQPYVVRLGKVDTKTSVAHPSIIKKHSKEHEGAFHEFFAPVFYVLVFDNDQDITKHLSNELISDFSMYISYFSQKDRLEDITFARCLKNFIINDVEQGNQAYGGFGKKANFVAFDDKHLCRPILISREISSFLTTESLS